MEHGRPGGRRLPGPPLAAGRLAEELPAGENPMSPSPNRRRKFPIYRQMDAMDCGPACLQMISRYYGKHFSLERLRERSALGRQGVSLLGLSYAAEQLGFRTLSTKATFDQLKNDAPLPCIAHWKQEHFVVVYKVTSKKVHVADPAEGRITHDIADFEKAWCSIRQGDRGMQIIVLVLTLRAL